MKICIKSSFIWIILPLLIACAKTGTRYELQSKLFQHGLRRDGLDPFGFSELSANNSRSSLLKRQGERCVNPDAYPCPDEDGCCKEGYDCVPGGCCPSGSLPCPTTDFCYKPGDTCCDEGGSCPEGHECCGDEKCCKQSTTSCCPSQDTCCSADETCCDDGLLGWCCRSGETCGKLFLECYEQKTTTSKKTSTTKTSSTKSSTKSSMPSKCPKGTDNGNAKRQENDDNKCLPLFDYPSIPDLTDDTTRSMCLGMNGANKVIYTYGGPGYRRVNYNRKCNGCCKGVLKDVGFYKGDVTECDEQPPGSVLEGGQNSHIACIIKEQNSIHGRLLLAFYTLWGLARDDKFINEVTYLDCSTVSESDLQGCGGKRLSQRDNQSPTSGLVDKVVKVNNTMGEFKLLVIPLDDTDSGDYTSSIELPSTSGIQDLVVVDGSGISYGELSASDVKSGSRMLRWNQPEFVSGLAIVARTTKDKDSMKYHVKHVASPRNLGSPARYAISSRHIIAAGTFTTICILLALLVLWI